MKKEFFDEKRNAIAKKKKGSVFQTDYLSRSAEEGRGSTVGGAPEIKSSEISLIEEIGVVSCFLLLLVLPSSMCVLCFLSNVLFQSHLQSISCLHKIFLPFIFFSHSFLKRELVEKFILDVVVAKMLL